MDSLHHLDKALLLHDEHEAAKEYEALVNFFSENGYFLANDFSHSMQEIASLHPDLVVRRESPERVIEAVGSHTSFDVQFDPEAHGGMDYPNAGILGGDARGLRIPYRRGFARVENEETAGSIIAVVGIIPELSLLKTQSLPADTYTHYKEPKERDLIRMVTGTVPIESVLFINILIPYKFFPEDMMTDHELDNESPYITRMFVKSQTNSHQGGLRKAA